MLYSFVAGSWVPVLQVAKLSQSGSERVLFSGWLTMEVMPACSHCAVLEVETLMMNVLPLWMRSGCGSISLLLGKRLLLSPCQSKEESCWYWLKCCIVLSMLFY